MHRKYYNSEFAKKRNIWLKEVSRTFYPSIKILPKDLHFYVGHSYLICRLLDTLEDAYDISVNKKTEALKEAVSCIKNINNFDKDDNLFFAIARSSDIKPFERTILENSFEVFECIDTFPDNVAGIIREWTVEMAEGMMKYSFGTDRKKLQLTNIEELEEYTYYVAGTVGELLSRLFTLDHFRMPEKSKQLMFDKSIAFGKALQYVNIIKDSREDFKEGRCFIPADLLKAEGIDLSEFFSGSQPEKIKNIYSELISRAENYLNAAVEYISVIPVRLWRIRLFCIWPVVLAYATLNGIKRDLDQFILTSKTYKIPRTLVISLLRKGYFAAFSNRYFKKIILFRF